MSKKQLHIFYSGMVQGVGFRYGAVTAAEDAGVVGWVKNCPDGRVEALCEGEEEAVELFLVNVRQVMGRYIRDEAITWGDPTGKFDDFQIQHF